MRIFTFIVILVLVSYVSNGQVLCGTEKPPQPVAINNNSSAAFLVTVDSAIVTYLPIELHIVRKSDGTGGVSMTDINSSLAHLNSYYIDAGIQFYIAHASPSYINSDTFYTFDSSEETQLCTDYDVNNALNLYILGSIKASNISVNGYAYYPSTTSSSNRVFIKESSFNDQRTVIHELGHYFNLFHTFQNNNSTDPTQKELVTRGSGANCSTTGDLVCDTPADPYGLSGATYSGCSYTGTIKDRNNEAYQPSLSNVMSYYTNCGNNFTNGQYQRMSEGLQLRKNNTNQYSFTAPISAGATPSNLIATKTNYGVSITFQDNSNSEFGYILERHDEKTNKFVALKGILANTTSILDTNIVSNKTYSYRVRASNSTNYSNIDTAYVKINYCIPTYNSNCSPAIITDFTLAGTGISKANSGCGTNSFSDFSSMVGNVTTGNAYTFTAKAQNSIFDTYNPQHVTIWIDFNQDGTFDNNTEKVFHTTNTAYMNPLLSDRFTIPHSAWAGKTRMRVRSNYVIYGIPTDACAKLSFGETEDYTLNITNNNTITTGTISPTTICPNSTISVNFTKSNIAPTEYIVQIAELGSTNFINLTTVGTASPLSAFIPENILGNKTYQVRVVSQNPPITGSISASTIYIKGIPTKPLFNMSDALICEGQSIVASVTNCSDGQIYWNNGSTSTSLNLTPTVSSSYTATCTINGCVSAESTLNISVTPIPTKPVINTSATAICYGESVTLSIINCEGNVLWSNSITQDTLKIFPLVSSTYSAICKVGECESSNSSSNITVNTSPIATITGPTSAIKGESVVLTVTLNSGNLPWSYTLTNGRIKSNISTSADTTQIRMDSSQVFSIAQVSNMCGNGTGHGVVAIDIPQPETKTVLDISAFLEGAYNTNTQSMRTTLNQRGLLPGQTPVGDSTMATPNGQPYNKSPWNYAGNEEMNNYAETAVDWVLVSLRTSPSIQDTIWRGAGILHNNGKIEFPNLSLLPLLTKDSSYYISIEHRNHLGVLSHIPIIVKNDTLSYDFSTQNSYTKTNITSFGQAQIGTIFALVSADAVKNPVNQNFDINITELNLWKHDNGLFDKYLDADFNLDAEVNYLDRVIFKHNNGLFSMIGQ